MLATGREFNIRNIPNQGLLVAKMSGRGINVNLGKLRGQREGKMRIAGPSWPWGPSPVPYLFMLGANEEVGGAVLCGVDHQGAVGRKQPPGSSSLVVFI